MRLQCRPGHFQDLLASKNDTASMLALFGRLKLPCGALRSTAVFPGWDFYLWTRTARKQQSLMPVDIICSRNTQLTLCPCDESYPPRVCRRGHPLEWRQSSFASNTDSSDRATMSRVCRVCIFPHQKHFQRLSSVPTASDSCPSFRGFSQFTSPSSVYQRSSLD